MSAPARTVTLTDDCYFRVLCVLQFELWGEQGKLKSYEEHEGLSVAAAIVRERVATLEADLAELKA